MDGNIELGIKMEVGLRKGSGEGREEWGCGDKGEIRDEDLDKKRAGLGLEMGMGIG